MEPAERLFAFVQQSFPSVYQEIQQTIQPHSIQALVKHFGAHLARSVPDLSIFNGVPREKIPQLCLAFAKAARKRFPSPGDAFGIQLTCRITKSDTQDTLDSKHLDYIEENREFNVDRGLRSDIELFSRQAQVFQLSSKQKHFSVFLERSTDKLGMFQKVPEMAWLERGMPFNKGRDQSGQLRYLTTFRFIYVPEQDKILYRSVKDLTLLFKRLDNVLAISDLKYVFQKCGIVSHFFNLHRVLERQLFTEGDSPARKDVMTVCKYQCRTGRPLPLSRDGLAKNPERTPIEVLSFEAPKKNYARLCCQRPPIETKVHSSADKIFFGQQFNEGTGYCGFEVRSG